MRLTALVPALALAAGFAAPAWAEVDVEVPANFKAKGTLDPSEVERFRFHAEEGTVLTLAASAAKGSTLDFDITLATDVGVPVGIPDPLVTDTGSKFAIKGLVIPATGDYQVVLAGTGSGGYSLSLKAKPQTIWTRTLGFGGAGLAQFAFAMPAGSTVSLLAKPAAGSGTVARLVSLDSDGPSIDLSTLGSKTATSHAVTVGPLAAGGDFILNVSNEGGAGDIEVAAKVKPPKAKPGKLDLRGSVLGRPTGGETFVGRVLGDAGGTVAVGGGAGDLDGAAVVLPPGALAGPTLVSIASSLPPPIGDPDDQAAGPAVLLGPSGLTFPVPAVLTLPVDISRIPADATINDVRILIVEDDGSSRIVLPTGFSAGTVTVETSGFSVCCPIVVSGPPALGLDPGGDEFWFIQFNAEFSEGSTDSRGRTISVDIGQLSFFGDGTMQYSEDDRRYDWQNFDSPPMSGQPISSNLTTFTGGNGATLNWAYDASKQNIVLSGIPETLPTFRMSRDGRYLAGRKDGSVSAAAEVQFGVRKNTTALTTASLNATWTGVFLQADVGNTSSTGAAEPQTARGIVTFQFDGSGGCKISFSERAPEFNASNGTFLHDLDSGSISNGTYAIDSDGTVAVTIPPGPGENGTVLRAHPGAGLDVLLVTHDNLLNDSAMGMVLVRQGTGLSKSSLSGAFHGAEFAVDSQSYFTQAPSNVHIADFGAQDQGVTGTFDGGATASFSFDTHKVNRDNSLSSGVFRGNENENLTVNVTVTSQGKFSIGDSQGKVVGAISPDAQFFVAVTDVANAGGDYAMYFVFRAPPDKTP